ncbi:hypothetical protein HK097_008851 [Rhizophlyctis rosea]|uniref:Uncharacterized protein n=1 Tax=Rhizophlyctis rosea TaxID=64517 RepID=A0AAD5X0U6_9FUNG|nr:hypothetical protein HK097_008851 [Rhizophlyctis rosea]
MNYFEAYKESSGNAMHKMELPLLQAHATHTSQQTAREEHQARTLEMELPLIPRMREEKPVTASILKPTLQSTDAAALYSPSGTELYDVLERFGGLIPQVMSPAAEQTVPSGSQKTLFDVVNVPLDAYESAHDLKCEIEDAMRDRETAEEMMDLMYPAHHSGSETGQHLRLAHGNRKRSLYPLEMGRTFSTFMNFIINEPNFAEVPIFSQGGDPELGLKYAARSFNED